MSRASCECGRPFPLLSPLISENDALRKMLAKATVRLGILRDRMEACDESVDEDRDGHALSRAELPAWIEEQEAFLYPTTPESER